MKNLETKFPIKEIFQECPPVTCSLSYQIPGCKPARGKERVKYKDYWHIPGFKYCNCFCVGEEKDDQKQISWADVYFRTLGCPYKNILSDVTRGLTFDH